MKSNNITSEAYQGMWTAENPSNLFPSANFEVQNMVMDRYVEDGSYFRCSDITLSYVLPKSLISKIGMKNMSVFASVKNAFILTDYSGYDPEGVFMNSFPTPRSYIFGLNLTF